MALVQVPVRFWSVILHKMASQLSSKQESTCSLLCHSEAEIWTCSSAGRHFPSFTLWKVSYCRFIFICGAAHPLSRLKAAASPLSLCHNCQWRITARPPSLPLWRQYLREVHMSDAPVTSPLLADVEEKKFPLVEVTKPSSLPDGCLEWMLWRTAASATIYASWHHILM